jgi:hexosaminidase
MRSMSHAVIPAPVRFDVSGGRGFAFRPGTPIEYTDASITPVVERFCSQVTRRTGLRLALMGGNPVPGEPSVMIELAAAGELGVLPAPAGVSPGGGGPADERHSLVISGDQVVVRAVEPAGVARGLTTLLQLVAAAPHGGAGEIRVPGARILDAPRYAWRGLSLDLARAFFTVAEIRRVIDLLVLYKLNVLHLHLTDDQSWRLPVGRPAGRPEPGAAFYSGEDLRALAAYAADRFVTVVPEVNTPGHASALMRLHPGLNTGRNQAEFELLPGLGQYTGWLDPELPATFALMEEVLAGVAAIFPGPYLHIGGDEPRRMPHGLYASYVDRIRRLVRSLGKHPLGWQESARAGLGPDDIIQYWLTGTARPASLPPKVRAQLDADLAMSRRDAETAVAAAASAIVSPQSHCYLDVPYAEPSAETAQAHRQGRAGLRLYAPRTVAEAFEWEPAEALGPGRELQVAGVEAVIWAETISDFKDLSFLLLPRLAGIAHKAWSDPRAASWTDHRDRLARHGRLWAQDDLTYFRTSAVHWL